MAEDLRILNVNPGRPSRLPISLLCVFRGGSSHGISGDGTQGAGHPGEEVYHAAVAFKILMIPHEVVGIRVASVNLL